ncbi:ABC transporter permease [Gemmatimonas sp.]|jgi:putative ABC transport system permease protein|uniref:ABC transporter permease n=1 Tax=Gemmatimonas sp. TaxID=1962908 RepID=UPI0022BFC79D|nr:ABC transporter permease [Gemmatimonas sp.]MCA2992014.1 ABC transporter permease [Gemmatimonas sp.]MCE2952302.1 ABC transporter permease [Gemmatimonas sp.]MCZ8012637.1 ABC transporter permease [Gemmatimonas sp.]MCZ8268388.1 ABC transporter permease [Gemmatimonas sp.]
MLPVDIFRLAFGQLRVNLLRTAFTLLGIVVSVGFLVAVVAIIQGMNAYVKENIAEAMIGMNTFQVRRLPLSLGLFTDDEFRLLQKRPRVDERDAAAVAAALPDAQAIGFSTGWPTPRADVVWRNRTLGSVLVFGVSEGYQAVQDYRFVAGRPLSELDVRERRPVVAIGADVAKDLFDEGNAIDQEVRIAGRRFTVVGVVAPKGRVLGQSFDAFVMIPIPAFESIWGRRQQTVVSVKMRTAEEVAPAMARAQEAMRVARHLRPADRDDFDIGTGEAFIAFWKQLTRVLFAVVPAVVAIGILVGGIVIMNIMLMAVTERTHEIGLRKAVGATAADVRRQFLAEAVALALAGGVLGVAAGWALAFVVSSVSPLPARVTPWSVALSLVLGAGIGVLFGVYPASRAARLDPITAMRAET